MAFHAIKVLPRLLYAFALCSAAVLMASRLASGWMKLVAALAISAMGMFVVQPLIDGAFVRVLKGVAFLDLPQIYNEPFKGHVLVVIYATFIEAVIAAFAIAALVWGQLSPSTPRLLVQFVSLVLFLKGSVLHVFLDSFWIRSPLPDALLSEAQFGLEALTMALLTGSAWRLIRGRGGSPPPASRGSRWRTWTRTAATNGSPSHGKGDRALEQQVLDVQQGQGSSPVRGSSSTVSS